MLAAVAPVVTEYFPAAQSLQAEADADEYLPAGHVRHTIFPSSLLNLPATQLLQMEVPVLEYFPTPQLEQVDMPTLEYFPESHFLHTVAPTVLENLEAAQFVQTLTPVYEEYVPALHGAHAVEPMLSLYVPVVQPEHSMPAGPVYPFSHTHLAMSICADKECPEYNGQMVHPVVA